MTDVKLASSGLEVVVHPEYGGAIGAITSRRSGRSLLFETPWGGAPGAPVQVEDGPRAWLERYRGGWHTLLPNGGTGCEVDGAIHGFHGEASVASWRTVDVRPVAVVMEVELFSVPFIMRRTVEVGDDIVSVREEITNLGVDPVDFMWVHHPAFGGDLLADGPTLGIDAPRLISDHGIDEGLSEAWPELVGPDGAVVNLSRPPDGCALLAYLIDLPEGRARVARSDGSLGATLRWDSAVFPHAWLWIELEGTRGWPWYGRCRTIGIEPTTTWPGHGLAEARQRGNSTMTLQPGETVDTIVSMEVEDRGATDGNEGA